MNEKDYFDCCTINQISDFFTKADSTDFWKYGTASAPVPLYKVVPAFDDTPKKPVTSIKSVMFRPPATIVFWSDGTKTAVVDEFMKGCKSYKIKVKDNRIVYVNSKGQKRSVNYKKWKEDGLTNALLKKMMPKYFKVLSKWC